MQCTNVCRLETFISLQALNLFLFIYQQSVLSFLLRLVCWIMFFRHLHEATLENCYWTYNKYFLHSWGGKNNEVKKIKSLGETNCTNIDSLLVFSQITVV